MDLSSNFLAHSLLLSISLLFCSAFWETPLHLSSTPSIDIFQLNFFSTLAIANLIFKCSYRFLTSAHPSIASCFLLLPFQRLHTTFPEVFLFVIFFPSFFFPIYLSWSLFFTLGVFFKCLWILSCSRMFESITKNLMEVLCVWVGLASGELHCRTVVLNRDRS